MLSVFKKPLLLAAMRANWSITFSSELPAMVLGWQGVCGKVWRVGRIGMVWRVGRGWRVRRVGRDFEEMETLLKQNETIT